MTEQYIPPVDHYDLRLPPLAPPRPEDAPVVGLLAQEPIRRGLQEVNDGISRQYRGIEADGKFVHELFRGTTPDGSGFALAEVADPAAIIAINPVHFKFDYALFGQVPGARYVAFGYKLENLSSDEGVAAALQPWDVLPAPQDRDGMLTLRVGSHVIKVPLASARRPPSFKGEAIVGFREAAFGQRRHKPATESVEWIYDDVDRVWDAASRPENVGNREELRGISRQLSQYRIERLAELYEHPEWFDEPKGIFDDVSDERWANLEANTGVTRKRLENSRSWARWLQENHIVHPDELDVITDMVVPKEPQTEGNYESYYLKGIGLEGEERALNNALYRHRMRQLEDLLGKEKFQMFKDARTASIWS